MNLDEVLVKLKSLSNPKDVEGMARFGINPEKTFGIRIPILREMAKEIKKDFENNPAKRHKLALDLWGSEYHEARILASMVDDYMLVDEKQMDDWVGDFDSWDVCDQCMMNLFVYTSHVWRKVEEWSKREPEFEKRAAFAAIAVLAWKDKKGKDEKFFPFFEIIKREAHDGRNFVKKAVNWALRQIGKRTLALNRYAIEAAKEIGSQDSKSAKWIAGDALKELQSEAVQKRFRQ